MGERDRLQHTRLLRALQARDGTQARRVVQEYVEEAWDNLATVVEANAGAADAAQAR